MTLATLIEIKLVGTFALFLGVLVWQLVSVRRALKADQERDGGSSERGDRRPSSRV